MSEAGPDDPRPERRAIPRSRPASDRETTTFSLEELPQGQPFPLHRRRLVAHGKPLAFVVTGDEILLELGCGEHTLLVTCIDSFEVCEHFVYLLRRDGRPLDLLVLPAAPGFLEELEIASPSEVSFGLFGAPGRWRLWVRAAGFWSFSPAALKLRTLRFWPAKRYLEARGPGSSRARLPPRRGAP